ncbi:ribosomal protein S18-alanine N-acetyltransferase [Sphingosinicella rhizophila]|uniref:Ribosomal protein S18-alanine N-acetyltransferase n=1 Tax=Sphingosinicella rhizophila TaxID=3050082 RepID=A0ABU3Q477_9SPHN|nr:ribosomal protein S18-alanine N-acetyltransferase [Sphingosinicella sp. GR2756]MDT9598222.1 ribosomal protein S18-alanine N-acetyltransferase [Sphingosinicella sp. GR2756]
MKNLDQIRLCEGGIIDLDAVMKVMDDSFDPVFGEAWTAPQCAGLMPMPGVWLSLAKAGTDLVGFALARIVSDEAELLLLAVKKQARGQGVGQLLLNRFSLVAGTRGAQQLHLEVRDGNPAINLYRRAGFAEVGRRRNYYNGKDGQVYDALTLARPLSI